MEEKTESVNAATTPWSPCREQWVQERAAAPSVANKACGHLEKLPYPRVLCGAKQRSHPWNSFNVVCRLCPPHTFRCTCMDQQSQIHVPCLLTNPHILVQSSLRCARKAYTANTYTYYTLYMYLTHFTVNCIQWYMYGEGLKRGAPCFNTNMTLWSTVVCTCN